MTEKHKNIINSLVNKHKDDPNALALIIIGSIATGKSRPDSDIDLYLVVTDDVFNDNYKIRKFFYGHAGDDEIEGVEIDGKIVGKEFLREAIKCGSEPTRASFRDAYCAFSKDQEIDELIKEIPVYPQSDRQEKIEAFYSQIQLNQYYLEQALEHGNELLTMKSLTDIVFFSARLVLAHNKLLYPCPKALFSTLSQAKEMPEGFIEKSEAILKSRDMDTINDYCDSVIDFFREHELPLINQIDYILENEFSWYTKKTSVADL